MKFDYVIGNPPYQENNKDNNRQSPVYHLFMEEAFKISPTVELITPARFLFDAGQTPSHWNKKMLNDKHYKVLFYEQDGTKIFPNHDIKGGIVISIRNTKQEYGAIGSFTTSEVLNSILQKVNPNSDTSICSICYPKSNYGFTEDLYKDFPSLKSRLTKGNEFIIDADIFKKMPEIFTTENDNMNIIRIYGRENNARISKQINAKYIKESPNLNKYKIFITGANGSGAFGEVLSSPFTASPKEIHTQTYMSIGHFDTKKEADFCLQYLKTKFARCLLSVLKVTQNNPRSTWAKIPLQDFTSKSDIDWSKSIHEIDLQLYKKYGLDDNEIKFIETHVKEMA